MTRGFQDIWAGQHARLSRWKAQLAAHVERIPRPFSRGRRPVIRWIKGDGKDDAVTRSALAGATRLFGDTVDYCLCTVDIPAARAREILAWAAQPVEWWPLTPDDNPKLAAVLRAAGCPPEKFGYWWKWFPERVRVRAPEWILDGDMAIVGAPPWFEAWRRGEDPLRVAQDDFWDSREMYGEYVDFADSSRRLYSGLVSLPPHLCYLPRLLEFLRAKPLQPRHDGRTNMSEQGAVAAVFDALRAVPIPLCEFPFARAFEADLNHGRSGPHGNVWGYHFGNAFRRDNPHFERLAQQGTLFWRTDEPTPEERFAWLRNYRQWGLPGWFMHPVCVQRMEALAREVAGRPVLEIGTSRGHLAAIMAAQGARVTTVDHADRGARVNLEGLDVEVHVAEALSFLRRSARQYALITVDLHGNRLRVWRKLWPLLQAHLEPAGRMALYNSHLWKLPEWRRETGLRWVMEQKLREFRVEVLEDPPPGMIVVHRV